MSRQFCNCRDCRRARRSGKVLGSRLMGYFSQGKFGWAYVSDYVLHHKFSKGRTRKDRNKLAQDED